MDNKSKTKLYESTINGVTEALVPIIDKHYSEGVSLDAIEVAINSVARMLIINKKSEVSKPMPHVPDTKGWY